MSVILATWAKSSPEQMKGGNRKTHLLEGCAGKPMCGLPGDLGRVQARLPGSGEWLTREAVIKRDVPGWRHAGCWIPWDHAGSDSTHSVTWVCWLGSGVQGRAGMSGQRRRPRMSIWHLYERWASNQKFILKDSYGTSKTRTWSRAPIQTKGLTPGIHKPRSCWNFRQWASRQFCSENISSCSTYCGKWVRLWWLHLNGW